MVVAGIIRPPPDIRAVADRTALFVSKNGRAFETKILNSAKGKTPKFAFLHGSSPFHAYYENRIVFYTEGGTDEEEKKKEEEEKLKKQKEKEERELLEKQEKEKEEAAAKKEAARRQKASAVDPIARALLTGRQTIEDAKRAATAAKDREKNGDNNNQDTTATPSTAGPIPPSTLKHVSLVAPANLTPLEVEVIKLTAQYVALSERKDPGTAPRSDNFLSSLTLKEWTNPEFQFLQPRHAHYAYFSALVDGYRSFLPGGDDYESAQNKARMDAKKERLANLIPDDSNTTNKDSQAKNKNKDTVQECLEAAAYRAEYEREMAERRRQAAEGADTLGGTGNIDWHDFVVVETIEFDADEVVEVLPPPSSLRLAALNKEQAEKDKLAAEKEQEAAKDDEMEESSSSSDDDVDMEEDDDEGGEKLKVVANYQPKVVSTKEITGDASRTHIVDPITGKSVPIADMPEHMRIQLLDPKWAEERKRFLDKQSETNYVAGGDIASNISRFAQARGDIFGSSEAEIHDQKVDAEKRLMEANRLIQEQMQPQPQQPPAMPPPPNMGMPPPIQPPIFAPPPPIPPPPVAQQMVPPPPVVADESEPAAKRIKLDDSNPSMPPPPVQPPTVAAQPPPPPPVPGQISENTILSEDDFIATLSDPDEIDICVRIPHDPSNSNWNFNGQTIDITIKPMSKIKDVKVMLKDQLGGMPVNKMQLKHPSSGFMNKDALTIAHYNIRPMTTIELVPKTRGGGRK